MIRSSKILQILVLSILSALLIFILLLDYGAIIIQKTLPAPEIVRDMDYQQTVKPMELDLKIPKNSIPRNVAWYKFDQTQYQIADTLYKNPIKRNQFVIARGKYLFETNCIYCHGNKGLGDGPIITKVVLKGDEEGFPAPPKLTRKETRSLSDGRLFHILSAGQNLMFSVADRIGVNDRWCLVWYIRHLQEDTSK